MFPTKEERKINRLRNKEQMHWSTFIALFMLIMINNSFLLASRSVIDLPLVLIGILIGFIPLISVWRARASQEKRRRLATKQLSEFSFIGAGIITVSFFLGMFNSNIDQDIYRTMAAIIAVSYWLVFGLICRYVYKQILAVQEVDTSEDSFSKRRIKLEYSISFVAFILVIGLYLYFIA